MSFASKNCCPLCGFAYPLPGPQPSGEMMARINSRYDCDGHPRVGTVEVRYEFPPGMQGSQHPHPGHGYSGTRRDVYLANDDTGHACLALLKSAFSQGMLFRIGQT